MEINSIFWNLVLILLLLVFFLKMAGIEQSQRIVSTYLNLIFQALLVIGQVLTRVAIPLLKHVGEKIIYTTNHYLAEAKKQNEQIGLPKPDGKATLNTKPEQPEPPPFEMPKPQEQQQKQKSSANPYDDPPEPEIMD